MYTDRMPSEGEMFFLSKSTGEHGHREMLTYTGEREGKNVVWAEGQKSSAKCCLQRLTQISMNDSCHLELKTLCKCLFFILSFNSKPLH